MKKAHSHYWSYPHTIWAGAGENDVIVARYCFECGKRQCATAKNWREIPKSYPDIIETVSKLPTRNHP